MPFFFCFFFTVFCWDQEVGMNCEVFVKCRFLYSKDFTEKYEYAIVFALMYLKRCSNHGVEHAIKLG